MLYLTTRTGSETFTANRALSEERGPGGGFYVPLKLPRFSEEEIKSLGENSFSQNVACIINLFFGTHLDSWSVEFAIGRYPVKVHRIGSREIVAETWHNPVWKFERLVRGIEKAIRQSDDINPVPSDWLITAVRIGVLFGIFGDLFRQGRVSPEELVDLAVPCGDFSAPMAVLYAKEMGLPIGTILCCCNDNNGAWKLLHKGEIRADAVSIATATPNCDHMVPVALERLLFSRLGKEFAVEFARHCNDGGTLYLEPEEQRILREGLYVPVTGHRRLESAINSLYSSCGYAADVYTALCYSGMLDYRSVTGEGRPVLIVSEESPIYSASYLSRCLGLSPREFKERLNRQR